MAVIAASRAAVDLGPGLHRTGQIDDDDHRGVVGGGATCPHHARSGTTRDRDDRVDRRAAGRQELVLEGLGLELHQSSRGSISITATVTLS